MLIVIGYKEVRCESVKNVLESNSTEDEYSTHIDMMLNPDKINQYKMDVKKTEHDIRFEWNKMALVIIAFGTNLPYKNF